jgi:hypothetical protein
VLSTGSVSVVGKSNNLRETGVRVAVVPVRIAAGKALAARCGSVYTPVQSDGGNMGGASAEKSVVSGKRMAEKWLPLNGS